MNTLTIKSVVTLTVIGDSAAYGIGDEVGGSPRGWAWYLSQLFYDQCAYQNFSRPGAQSAEVLELQLPRALATEPDICAVIVGGNDLLRNGFSPKNLQENLRETCAQLMEIGSEVVMIELHDPNQLLRLPRLLKRVLRRRVESVNNVYYQIADELDVLLIRTRAIPDVHSLKNWHIDRMHPGPHGHQILAREMAEKLRRRGWSLRLPIVEDRKRESSRKQLKWLIANGVPWFAKRSFDLLPAALILMAIEFLRVIYEIITLQSDSRPLSVQSFEVKTAGSRNLGAFGAFRS